MAEINFTNIFSSVKNQNQSLNSIETQIQSPNDSIFSEDIQAKNTFDSINELSDQDFDILNLITNLEENESSDSLSDTTVQQKTIELFENQLESSTNALLEQNENDGIINQGFNLIKELTNLGISKKDAENAVKEQQELIQELKTAQKEDTFNEKYLELTGVTFDPKKIEQYQKEENKLLLLNAGTQKAQKFYNTINNTNNPKEILNQYKQYFGDNKEGEKEFAQMILDSYKLNSSISNQNVQEVSIQNDTITIIHLNEFGQEKTTTKKIENISQQEISSIQSNNYGNKYKEHFIEKFEKATGENKEKLEQKVQQLQKEAFGDGNKIQETINKYCKSQEGFSDTLAASMQIGGIILMGGGSVLCTTGVGIGLGTAIASGGQKLAVAGTFLDEGLDLINTATSKNNTDTSKYFKIAKDAITDATLMYSGIKIGQGASAIKDLTLTKTGSTLLSSTSEIGVDASLSILSDLILTGEADLKGEGLNQILSAITGIGINKTKGNTDTKNKTDITDTSTEVFSKNTGNKVNENAIEESTKAENESLTNSNSTQRPKSKSSNETVEYSETTSKINEPYDKLKAITKLNLSSEESHKLSKFNNMFVKTCEKTKNLFDNSINKKLNSGDNLTFDDYMFLNCNGYTNELYSPQEYVDAFLYFKNLETEDGYKILFNDDNSTNKYQNIKAMMGIDPSSTDASYLQTMLELMQDYTINPLAINSIQTKDSLLNNNDSGFNSQVSSNGWAISNQAKRDIDLIYDTILNNKNKNRLFTEINNNYIPSYKNETEAIKNRETGDAFILDNEDKIRIKTNDNTSELMNISKETYLKLFPPLERFSTTQTYLQDCYCIETFMNLFSDNTTRAKLIRTISEDELGNITINLPNSKTSTTFSKGELPESEDEFLYSSGAVGYKLFEYAYSENLVQRAVDEAKNNLDGEKLDEFLDFIEKNKNDFYIDSSNNTPVWMKYSEAVETNQLKKNNYKTFNAYLLGNGGFSSQIAQVMDMDYEIYLNEKYSTDTLEQAVEKIKKATPNADDSVFYGMDDFINKLESQSTFDNNNVQLSIKGHAYSLSREADENGNINYYIYNPHQQAFPIKCNPDDIKELYKQKIISRVTLVKKN